MKLHLDVSEMTLDDLEEFETARAQMQEGGTNWGQMREFLAHFAYEDNQNGEEPVKIPLDEAKKRVGKLSIETVLTASKVFAEQMERLVGEAVPPRTGSPSS